MDDFEWDAAKDLRNQLRHAVSFSEATTVFGDPLTLILHDTDHSASEDRYIALGRSRADRLLVVAFTERPGRIRMISARVATPRERKHYESSR